jgi:MFS transporter, YQGE family, putative transporter
MRTIAALNKQEIKMVIINGTYAMASAMTAVFVNVYLYKFTGSLVTMTAYAMVRFGFFPIAFTIGAHISRKYRLSWTMTAGLLMIVFGLLVILTLRERIGELGYAIYGIGMIFGMGEGFFWLSTVSLNQLVSTKESRGKYLGFIGMFNGLTNIIAPLTAAQIVAWSPNDTEGYIRIFQLVIVLYLIIAYLASTIRVLSQKGKFTILDKVFNKKDRQWTYIFNSHVLFGVRDSLVLMLTGLLIYRATGGSGSAYGRILALFALISILAFYIAGKFITRQNRLKMYQFGAFFHRIEYGHLGIGSDNDRCDCLWSTSFFGCSFLCQSISNHYHERYVGLYGKGKYPGTCHFEGNRYYCRTAVGNAYDNHVLIYIP